MLEPLFADRLEAAATTAHGSAAGGWSASLKPLNHHEITNDLWTASLDGRAVFVKRHARPDRYRNEVCALALANRAGIRVPDVLLAIDDLNVLVLAKLDGTPLNALWPRLDATRQCHLSEQAGALAARLHAACPGPAFGIRASPGPEAGTEWQEYLGILLDRWLEAVANEPFPVAWAEVGDTFARYAATRSFTSLPCLVHFDISARNLILAPQSKADDNALGLLDFELARYDHPGMDFHNAMGAKWLGYDETLTAAFRRGVASIASPAEVAEYDRHHVFFMGIVSLSTLAYLAKIGNPISSKRFQEHQGGQLLNALDALANGVRK